MSSIKIHNAALDDHDGKIILRGVISQDSLPILQVDDYQREALGVNQRSSLMDALKKGESLPDLVLAMRGEKHSLRNGVYFLHDPVFIVDGLQRQTTLLEFLSGNPEAKLHVGVGVYFHTTKEWEKERFRVLNMNRIKVAPSILLRNAREESPAAQALWSLSNNDRPFVMCGKVCWSQNMHRGELITALMFARVAAVIHSHKSSTGIRDNVECMITSLDGVVEAVGIQNMRDNIRTFWALIDECWGIKRIHNRAGAPYIKGTFLDVLAKLLSDHYDFWSDDAEKKLFIDAPLRRKIGLFPINDPAISTLAGSGGKSREMLYMMMRDHINSGKRTKKLRSRNADAVVMNLAENLDEEAPQPVV